MSLIKSTATIGFYTLLSRVLGFIRDMTIASTLGASMLSDAFFVAFKIPNFLRRLFAEGAFNSAFVPLYAGILAGDGKEAARAFANQALSFMVVILIIVSALCIFFMPWLMVMLAPGFSDNPEKYTLTVTLTQITMPYILFISVVCLLGGILNSVHKFAAVAATPILMNLCLIFVPMLIGHRLPTEAHALAVAVFMAGVAQMIWLFVFCRKMGVAPRILKPQMTPEVKKLFILMGPAALGAGVAQINLFIDLIIASTIPNGVSYLYYADRINELPLAVIGIAVGTVLLPMLSKQIREGKLQEARHNQNRAIELALFLSLPACAGIITLAEPLVRVLYERGAFGDVEARATIPALIAFACGLPAFVLVKVLSPSFYANQDTKTPFYIATICIVVNLVLNLALIGPLKHVGMAVATSIAGWLNVALMYGILSKRELFAVDTVLIKRMPRIIAASVLMAGLLVWLAPYAAFAFKGTWVLKVAMLVLLVTAGFAFYMALVLLLKATDTAKLVSLLKRRPMVQNMEGE